MTKAQRSVLEFAADCPRRGLDGVIAKGSRRRAIAALEAAGLLAYVGEGVEVDGDGCSMQEWPIYEITDAGRSRLSSPTPRRGGKRA